MKLNLTFLLLLSTLSLFAQKNKAPNAQAPAKTETSTGASKKWDINAPSGAGWNWKDVNFTTDEGTWLNLDTTLC